jgi:hypothetical protein
VCNPTPATPRAPKIRILVAHPTLRFASTDHIAGMMLKLGMMSIMEESPWEFSYKSSSGYSGLSYPVDYQRNMLAKEAIDKGYDWIWFVDSDTLPDDSFAKLLQILPHADAVAGIYPLFGKPPDPPVAWTAYEWLEGLNMDKPDAPHAGFMLADPNEHSYIVGGAAGTGAMLISRKVLIDPAMRLAPGDDPPVIFKLRYEPSGKLIATEDMDFCRRLRDNGYKLITDCSARWGHVKTFDVVGVEKCMQWAFDQGRDHERNASGNTRNAPVVRPLGCTGPLWNGDANAGLNQGFAPSQR